MKFTTSMKKNYEFQRLYSKGACAATPFLVVYARKSKKDTNRLGITVSTKVGKAVTRNRVRRRIREIYRLHEGETAKGTHLVVVARARAAAASYRQLEQAYLKACGRLALLEKGDAL